MTERAEPRQPLNWGIEPERLQQVLPKVKALYEEIAGIELGEHADHLLAPGRILEDLKIGFPTEYRFGSRISMHSKLWIKQVRGSGVIYFRFDSNVGEDLWKSKGHKMEDEFKQKINEYLLEAEIGQPLPAWTN